MTDANALAAFSDHISQLVERVAPCVVAVHGGRRWSASGMHWRSGVIVTAEEALDRDEDITLTLPGGREVKASLAGRDPTTDVAVLRFDSSGKLDSSFGKEGIARFDLGTGKATSASAYVGEFVYE